MPGATLPPGSSRQVGSVIARVERGERRTVPPGTTPPEHMIFSYPGVMNDGVQSPPWYVPRTGLISLVRVSTTVSASVTITVNVNGTAVTTFAKTGVTHMFPAAIGVTYGDYVTISTVTANSASDMSVDIRLS